jgi:hypothetical protein
MNKLTRRNLVKGAVAISAGTLIARVSHAQEILTEDDGTALAMGYKADHTAVDTSVWSKKAGPTGRISSARAVRYTRLKTTSTVCALYLPASAFTPRAGAMAGFRSSNGLGTAGDQLPASHTGFSAE